MYPPHSILLYTTLGVSGVGWTTTPPGKRGRTDTTVRRLQRPPQGRKEEQTRVASLRRDRHDSAQDAAQGAAFRQRSLEERGGGEEKEEKVPCPGRLWGRARPGDPGITPHPPPGECRAAILRLARTHHRYPGSPAPPPRSSNLGTHARTRARQGGRPPGGRAQRLPTSDRGLSHKGNGGGARCSSGAAAVMTPSRKLRHRSNCPRHHKGCFSRGLLWPPTVFPGPNRPTG